MARARDSLAPFRRRARMRRGLRAARWALLALVLAAVLVLAVAAIPGVRDLLIR